MKRNDKIYCIDNLYKKYDSSRYNFIKKKYGIVKNQKSIFRFNRYTKRSYIIKLLKDDFYVILDEDETYKSVADDILKNGTINNYKEYIRNMYLEKFLLNLDNIEEEEEEDNFEIKIEKKICFHPPCLNIVIGDNYCSIHK